MTSWLPSSTITRPRWRAASRSSRIQRLEHAAIVGPAVERVAELDEPRIAADPVPGPVGEARGLQEPEQGLIGTVHVADRDQPGARMRGDARREPQNQEQERGGAAPQARVHPATPEASSSALPTLATTVRSSAE